MPQAVASSSVIPPRLAAALPYYFLILAVLIAYGGIYDNAFLYDDKFLILDNRYLRNWHQIGDIFTHYVNTGTDRFGRFYRPLQNLLYLLIYQIAGPSPPAFHLLNLSLHAINACLAYGLGVRLGMQPRAVFWAALLWTLHPVQTEAVTYMSATADTLGPLFCLLGLIAITPQATLRHTILACVCMTLGLLSKETAIIFPLLAMACRFYQTPQPFRLKPYRGLWSFVFIAAVYLSLRLTLLPFHADDLVNIDPTSQIYAHNIAVRFYTFLATIPHYAELLLWPIGLHMDRNFPIYLAPDYRQVIFGCVIIAAAAFIIAKSRSPRMRPLGFGLIWCAAAHLPQTGIVIPVNSILLEHWLYLPSIGLSFGIAEAVARASIPKRLSIIATPALIVLATTLGIMTYNQNKIWHDAFVFYGNIFAHGESSYRAHNNLGTAYLAVGDTERAMQQFRYNTEHQDYSPEAHQNIAAALMAEPDYRAHYDEAIVEMQRALQLNPHFVAAYLGLAQIYDSMGRTADAASARRQADEQRRMLSQ